MPPGRGPRRLLFVLDARKPKSENAGDDGGAAWCSEGEGHGRLGSAAMAGRMAAAMNESTLVQSSRRISVTCILGKVLLISRCIPQIERDYIRSEASVLNKTAVWHAKAITGRVVHAQRAQLQDEVSNGPLTTYPKGGRERMEV